MAAASKSDDLEVRLRAIEVLEEWEKLPLRRPDPDQLRRNENFREACHRYFSQIDDDPRLAIVMKRVSAALKVGLLDQETRQGVRTCLRRLAALKQDRWFDSFRPLLDHDDPEVTLFLLHSIGAAKQVDFFPSLLIAALDNERDPVVEAVLSWSLDCGDKERRAALKEKLLQLVEKGPEPLKFRACWTLMRDFQDQAAFEYIVSQVKHEDTARVRVALGWLSDDCNAGRKVTPELIAAVSPHLSSDDFFLRRDAAQALAIFRGEEVVRRLVPLLADEKPAIVELVSAELVREHDLELKRQLLLVASEQQENGPLRERARKVLARLEAAQARSP